MKVRYSRLALHDLDDILDYIARDNPAAAHSLIVRIKMSVERLGGHPYMGRATDDDMAGARVFPVPGTKYKVFYDIVSAEVRILRVLHGAMDD